MDIFAVKLWYIWCAVALAANWLANTPIVYKQNIRNVHRTFYYYVVDVVDVVDVVIVVVVLAIATSQLHNFPINKFRMVWSPPFGVGDTQLTTCCISQTRSYNRTWPGAVLLFACIRNRNEYQWWRWCMVCRVVAFEDGTAGVEWEEKEHNVHKHYVHLCSWFLFTYHRRQHKWYTKYVRKNSRKKCEERGAQEMGVILMIKRAVGWVEKIYIYIADRYIVW